MSLYPVPPESCLSGHLLTPDDVASRLAVSRSMVYKLLRTGDLLAVYVGRLPRIEEVTLARYVERQRGRVRGIVGAAR